MHPCILICTAELLCAVVLGGLRHPRPGSCGNKGDPWTHAQVVAQKMAKLQPRGSHVQRPLAEVLIKRRKKGRQGDTWELVRARGHLDEVQELRKGGTKLVGESGSKG